MSFGAGSTEIVSASLGAPVVTVAMMNPACIHLDRPVSIQITHHKLALARDGIITCPVAGFCLHLLFEYDGTLVAHRSHLETIKQGNVICGAYDANCICPGCTLYLCGLGTGPREIIVESAGNPSSRAQAGGRACPSGSVSKLILCIATDTLRGSLLSKHIKHRFHSVHPSIRPAMESPSNNAHFGRDINSLSRRHKGMSMATCKLQVKPLSPRGVTCSTS